MVRTCVAIILMHLPQSLTQAVALPLEAIVGTYAAVILVHRL
jgi:hypothetical protein